MEPLYFCTTA